MGGVESSACGSCDCDVSATAPAAWEPTSSLRPLPEAPIGKDPMRILDEKFERAELLEGKKNAARAKALLQEVLRGYGNLLGWEHLKTGRVHFSLGSVAYDSKEYGTAKSRYEQALLIGRSMANSDGDDEALGLVANSLNNLGMTNHRLGDLLEARRCYEEAAEVKRDTLGERHSEVANVYNNLAAVACEEGNFGEARELYTRDLDIMISTLGGPTHEDIAPCFSNLGNVAFQRRDFAEAKALYWRALDIQRRAYGNDHLAVARTYINLALVVEEQCEWRVANEFYSQALQIQVVHLGRKHPEVARSTADVALMEARIAAASGNLCGAKKLYRRALELYDELPGSNESRVLDAEEELEDVLLRMYRPDQRKYGRSRRTRNRITSDRSNGSTTASLSGSIHGSMWSESDIDIASLP
jgi:tetratricopeptide (TPR) repeat protein